MESLDNLKALANILNSIDVEIKNFLLREDVYLVGGAIRDVLNNKQLVTDLDIVVREPLETLKNLRKIAKFTVIVLDEDFGVYRVYLPEKSIYLDFSKLQGKDIIEDLERRDFTINAIAVRWIRNRFEIIDPFDGIEDLHKGLIRTIKRKNLVDDPLRIIRAFRFYAELGFKIEEKTLNYLKDLKFLINLSAPERIKFELSKIFNNLNSHKTISFMYECGVLQELFPFLEVYKGFYSGKRHVYDLWEHSLKTLENIEFFINNRDFPILIDEQLLHKETEKEFNYMTILKISSLFHDVGKLFSYDERGDKIVFYKHEIYGANYLERLLKEKKYAKDTVNSIVNIVRYHMYPFHLATSKLKNINSRIYLRLKKDLADLVPLVFLLFIADLSATNRDEETKFMIEKAKKIYNEYLELKKRDINLKPILNGVDIMKILNISEGPSIGKIINKLREAQLKGIVNTREDAEGYIKQIYEN
ncbi:MAG: HD domain-containing protein [Proteobacteria bacterium]|nr:HD domain-containing protein [Pseudomonadota bacterium]